MKTKKQLPKGSQKTVQQLPPALQTAEQFLIAQRRVGEKPVDRLRWLLDFARKDLDLLHPEERRALGYDLRALVFKTYPPAFADFRAYVMTPDDESIVQRLHDEIKKGLAGLFSEGDKSWSFKQPEHVSIHRSTKLNSKRIGFVKKLSFTRLDEKDTILHGVMEILLECGGLLRACAECRSPFIPVRRQEYCSVRCSQRARDRRRSK